MSRSRCRQNVPTRALHSLSLQARGIGWSLVISASTCGAAEAVCLVAPIRQTAATRVIDLRRAMARAILIAAERVPEIDVRVHHQPIMSAFEADPHVVDVVGNIHLLLAGRV